MGLTVSVVVVSYNSSAYIDRCLASAYASSLRPIEVIVVDNASADDTCDRVAAHFPQATLVRGERNLGFAAGSNIGIARSSGDLVLLLNPDAILEPDCLATMVRFMEDAPRVALAGCRLVNDDGSLQCSIGRFPTLANQIGRLLLLQRLFPKSAALQELDMRPERYLTSHDVEWLFGAVLLARREAFEEVGVFDEDYFLFSEEQDWCLRMLRAGWRVSYVAEATATHLGRGGVGAPEVYVHLLNSRNTFITKHYGRLAAAASRALLLVGLALRYAGSSASAALSSSEDSLRSARAYASGIRWALLDRRAS